MLIGNSVGSLTCLIAAAGTFCLFLFVGKVVHSTRFAKWEYLLFLVPTESRQTFIRGVVLLNCAGGMNNKAIVDDWRIKLLLPLLMFFDFLLRQRGIASVIFDRVKQR